MTSPAPLAPPAGRQGPGPMAGRLVEALDLSFARRAGGPLPGEHRAPGVGAGTELAALRAYQPGDDVRRLDAAATARTGEPHVRLDVPERLVTTWLVLDVSPSMAFGTAERLKSDVAEGAVRVLARLATRRGGRGADGLRRRARAVLPPRGGRGAGVALERMLRAGVVPDGQRRPGGLDERSAGWRGWRASPGWWWWSPTSAASPSWAGRCARSPRATRSRRSRCAIRARRRCPRSAACALIDPETGAQVEVDTRDRRLRERYAAQRARRAGGRAGRAAPARASTTSCSPRTHPGCATSADGSRPWEPAAVSFQAPLFLTALAGRAARAAAPTRSPAAAGAATPCASPARRRLPRSSTRVPAWRRHLPAALFAAALAALAMALARPQATVAVPVEQASVLLVTDVSGSMQATDVEPTRLDAARERRARLPRGGAGRGARGRGRLLHGSAHPRPPRHRPLERWRS